MTFHSFIHWTISPVEFKKLHWPRLKLKLNSMNKDETVKKLMDLNVREIEIE